MILIQRYIFKELLYNFLFAFAVISLIMVLATSVKVIFDSPLGFLMLVRTLPFMLTATLSIIIPASALVSTVMTYGRVASDNELVTMRASGIHVLRVIVPGLLFGLLASFFLLVINDWVVPRAQRRAKAMLSSESLMELLDTGLLRGKRELRWASYLLTWEDCRKVELPEGERDGKDPLRQWRFYGFRAKEYDQEKTLIREIRAESATIIAAESEGKINIRLIKAEFTEGERKGATMGEFTLSLPLDKGRQSKVRPDMRSLPALAAILERDVKAYPDVVVKAEIHKRIADSFGPLVLIFLSLPMAILFRQQNRIVAFLFAILIGIFTYYPVTFLGETFAKKGKLPPALCIWPGAALLSLLGFVLILRVMKR